MPPDAVMIQPGTQPDFVEVDRVLLDLDTADLNYIQFPEFSLGRRREFRRKARKLAGDWDLELLRPLHWSSAYEAGLHGQQGMIPLADYMFYTSLEQHFLAGAAWRDTPWYQWFTARMATAPIERYGTPASVQERLDFLDMLYASYRSGDQSFQSGIRPVVNLGRGGRIAIEDGRHRLCVAKIARARHVSVSVCVLHPDA